MFHCGDREEEGLVLDRGDREKKEGLVFHCGDREEGLVSLTRTEESGTRD